MQWTDDDVRAFLARYGRVPAQLHVTQLPSWWRNVVLRVEADDETFILKRYGVTPAAEVAWEIELLAALQAHGFPAIEPISMAGTEQALTAFLDAPAILYHSIDGVPGREVDWEVAAPTAARLVARLHSITRGAALHAPRVVAGAEPVRTLARLETAARGQLERAPQLAAFVAAARSLTRSVALRAELNEVRMGVVHHDAHGGNTLFRGGELVGLIDFDDAYEGPLIADVAALVANWCVDAAGRLNVEQADLVLHAYEDELPLSMHERALLVDFVLLHALGDAMEEARTALDRGVEGDAALESSAALARYRAWRSDTDALDVLHRRFG